MIGKQLPQPKGRWALVNGRLILEREIVDGQALILEKDKIVGIAGPETLGEDVKQIDVGGRYVTPGLIDIHTHGGVGHTFNEPTEEAFAAITRENVTRGVSSLLATLSTASLSNLESCLEYSRVWLAEPREGSQVLGVHQEGPCFALSQKGAQDPGNFLTPDDPRLERLLAYHDIIKIMTFAPELPGAVALTSRLVELGIVPAGGHSDARDEDMRKTMLAGMRHVIHLWSGQSSTVREGPWRKPGILEASLAFEGLTAEMITDGKHLPPTLMKIAYRCIGPDRLCIISDATSGAGLPDGTRFRMGELEYEVVDGVGMMFDRSAFAGSTTLVNEMIPILVNTVGVPLVEAVRMASQTPARVIGLDHRKGSLAAGKDADVAIFEDDFTAWRTIIGGCWAYAV